MPAKHTSKGDIMMKLILVFHLYFFNFSFSLFPQRFYVPADTWAVQVNVSRCAAHGFPKDGKTAPGCPLIVMSSGRSLPNPDHPGTA